MKLREYSWGKYDLLDHNKWNWKTDAKVELMVLVGEYTPKEHRKIRNSILAYF